MRGIARLLLLLGVLLPDAGSAEVVVGSKKFTESVILGELARQLGTAAGVPVRHRASLGGTRVLWSALLAGDVDVYPEYTGTLLLEILPADAAMDAPPGGGWEALRAALAARGVGVTPALGFENTYALGMLAARAEALGIRGIGDLGRHPGLALGFSNEFMDRPDGWPAVREAYRLPHAGVRGLDHDLAYRGLASGALDATDLYSTDAEIPYYGLRVLDDPRGVFPEYQALYVYRLELEQRAPALLAALGSLAGRIDAEEVAAMNARAKLNGVPAAEVAAAFLEEELGAGASGGAPAPAGMAARIAGRTGEHLVLVAVSLGAAVAVGIPLGIVGRFHPGAGQAVLAVTGIIQTIPALALLVFMIPLFGIGGVPAVMALFLYSLLPIVRNTYTGLWGIPEELRLSAEALGLPAWARLRRVELPLAAPMILAGIKTSAVINIGTATLGALIGAGGYGQPILTGIRLDDMGLILEGAVPAAVLALLAQGLFEALQRRVGPRPMR